ncbi:MAG: TauD/TfdA family dioxygenase [Lautropia sp.]|nr:TauD/TfdA family dioxygenase [Lautropia sp.]
MSAAATPSLRHIRVEPLTGVIGAEIHGIDLREPLTPEVAQEVLDAFGRHQVIVLPNQDVSHEAHRAFAALFGPVGRVPQLHHSEGFPDVQIIRRGAQDTGRCPLTAAIPAFSACTLPTTPFLPPAGRCSIH